MSSRPPQRPQGSLGRRLQQRSDAPDIDDGSGNYAPRDHDDSYPPSRGARSHPRPEDEGYPPARGGGRSRSHADERDGPDERAYGPPRDRRQPTSAGGRGRGPDEQDAGAPDDGYGPGGRGDSRGRPPARPTPGRRPPMDDGRADPDMRRDSRRSGGPARSAEPDPNFPAWDESSDYANNPYGPNRGGPPTRGASGPGARSGPSGPGRGAPRYDGYDGYDDGGRRGGARFDEPAGYTDERPASAFPPGADAFSAEFEAARRSQDDRRLAPRGPGAGRGPNRYDDGYEDYGQVGRDRRDMSGGYGEAGWGAPAAGSRGGRAAYAESDVWQPGAPGIEVRPYAGAVGGAAPARKNGGWFRIAFAIVAAIVVVVGLVVVVGPGLAPKLSKYVPFLKSGPVATQPPVFATYTPGPTPTTPPNDKLFSSANDGFAMAYPSSWATATTNNAASNDSVNSFTLPNSSDVVIVERPSALDSASNDQIIQAEINGTTQQGLTLTEITGLATTEGVGGEIWQRHEYTVTNKSGAKLHLALLVCHHLGKAYAIVLIGSDTGFANDDTATFEPMLRTFRFL